MKMGFTSKEPSTAQILEQRTLEIIGSINTRTFEVLEKYTSSSFTDNFQPHSSTVINRKESAITSRRAIAEMHPNWSVELSNVSSQVDEDKGEAVVWILIANTGKPTGHRKESVSQMHWKRYTGRGWLCTKHVALSDVPRLFC